MRFDEFRKDQICTVFVIQKVLEFFVVDLNAQADARFAIVLGPTKRNLVYGGGSDKLARGAPDIDRGGCGVVANEVEVLAGSVVTRFQ